MTSTSFGMQIMATKPSFCEVKMGPVDPMFVLKREFDQDCTPSKVDLGAGVLRDEQGGTYEFPVLGKAKERLREGKVDHDYRPTTGIESYRNQAAQLMFGETSKALRAGRIASIQTVAGTGACRIGAVLLNKHWPSTSLEGSLGPFSNEQAVYLGVPTWGNYEPLLQHAGLSNVRTFEHLDKNFNLNFPATMEALTSAPEQSIFVLEGCCHNPTGQDYSQTQWAEIADMMLAKGHFAYLDTAYQGLGQGSDQDAWAVRHFAEQGVNMLVAQSFSKNMGLYSERVGALHVVCSSATIAANVLDQMRSLLRWEVSSSPSYGAQLVEIILSDTVLRREWQSELQRARQRLTGLRRDLHALLTKQKTASPRTGTVEGWSHLLEENGLFSFTGLTNVQAQRLIDMHHIYLPGSGRINVSGLNADSIERVARAFHDVITC